jgi:transposase
MTIIRIGLDASKHVFQVHGVDDAERPVLRRQVRRSALEKFFAKLAPTRIGIEACGASHYGARVLRGLGHEVVLLPPQHLKPYVKRGKNDAIAAICAAMSRGPSAHGLVPWAGMRFVPVKSAESQAGLMVLRVRELLVKQRTMLINAIRGHAAEFGVTAAQGPVKVSELLQRVHAEETGVPAQAREMLSLLAGQLDAVEARLKTLEGQLPAVHKANPASQCLATIPGVGPIGAVSFALRAPDPKAFRSGRHFAAWLGLTPRQNATGGRHRLGRISREGDQTPRKPLVLGATAVIKQANPRVKPAGQGPTGRTSPWLLQLLARRPKKLAAVALANKACPGAGRGWPASSGP